MYDQLIRYYQDIPTETWIAIFGAGTVSVIVQFGKKLLKLTNDKIIQLFFAVVAFAASALQYLLSAKNIPPSVLGLHTATLMGIATPLYFTVIKPANSFIVELKAFIAVRRASNPTQDSAISGIGASPAVSQPSALDDLIETGKGMPEINTTPTEFQA